MSIPPQLILIAPDSFKGCLSAAEVADAITEGVRNACPECAYLQIPVADGGEGFTEALLAACGGERRSCTVSDPLGRPVNAVYGILPDGTAVIEAAAASGLTRLSPEERDPLTANSFGTGQLIREAIGTGCRKVLIGLGGSATHDVGTGLLAALGFRFLDADGNVLEPCGKMLSRIASLDRSGVLPALDSTEFTAACDVETVFCGPAGAAETFAPQKGADAAAVRLLDEGSAHLAGLLLQETGTDLRTLPGSGAAGGIGGALALLLGARLTSGINLVLDATGFDKGLQKASLVITGEGRIDAQSAQGKAVSGILRRARQAGVPVVAIGGRVTPEAASLPFSACYALADKTVPDRTAMQPGWARKRITDLVGTILRQESYWMKPAK